MAYSNNGYTYSGLSNNSVTYVVKELINTINKNSESIEELQNDLIDLYKRVIYLEEHRDMNMGKHFTCPGLDEMLKGVPGLDGIC